MRRNLNLLWSAAVMLASIACAALWPMGYAPSYGPLDSCVPTTQGTCIAPVTDETVTL